MLLEPKNVTVKTLKGVEKVYVLSMFPAIAGREIVANYPLTAMPKAGDYKLNEATMLKLMCFVGVPMPNGETLPLTTEALVNNHVPDYETLVRIEIEMMRYNTSFFGNGEISTFFTEWVRKAVASVSPTLIASLAQSLQTIRQRLKNSEQNTP